MGCVTGWDRPNREGTGVGNTDHDHSPDHCPQPSGEAPLESPQTLCANPTPHSPTLTCVLSPSDYSTFYMTKGQPSTVATIWPEGVAGSPRGTLNTK